MRTKGIVLMGMLLSLFLTSCKPEDEVLIVVETPVVVEPDARGVLSGGYGTGGTFTVTPDGIKFRGDWNGNSAPGPVIYLSNTARPSCDFDAPANSLYVGPAQKSKGAWDIGTTRALEFKYVIIWCEPFCTYIGGGRIPMS